jgi:hypothetical protein
MAEEEGVSDTEMNEAMDQHCADEQQQRELPRPPASSVPALLSGDE